MGDDTPPKPLSVRAFARMRGCSHEAVRLAILDGRLSKAVVLDSNGKPKIGDPAMAMRELDATTDLSKASVAVKVQASERRRGAHEEGASEVAGHDAGVYDLAEEAAREKHWKANLAELDYNVRAGNLVPVEEVEAKFIDAVSAAKTKLLGLSTRIKQRLPHVSADDIKTIHGLVREALEDLADGR